MDIENIKAFVMVAELESISAAAIKLNHIQSNMTAKIQKVEKHYNQMLFSRNSKGVTLTESGKKLYDQFKKILLLWEETEIKMGKSEEQLRIGTMISIGGAMFSDALDRLYNSYPALSVTFKTGSTEYLEKQIVHGHLDIAYTIGAMHNKKVKYQKIGLDEMVIIGKGIRTNTNFYDYIFGKDLITLSNKCLYFSKLDQIFTDHNIKQGEIIEVGDFEALVQFSTIGMGIAIVSKHVANRFNVKDYLEVPSPYKYIDLYLISRRNHEFSCLEEQVIELSKLA
ncbi:DNA-binding transcriptional regulator, LysR family [Gracilibacillus orientalis]|uniref:DNA-binding transcriptional regulator, LysR family n=1 Tax=Gracilibacillus orientalis TaxID=334253 RepID=A0A1I4MSJ6_9BACI|nr:LysR family transcriptional regulator [Gracilibacillus orientalis]SFM06281.1 DNA-binding transcriptional regulator, LysR family [Gracilibacillus orientalis]